jgi:hypothetical protein
MTIKNTIYFAACKLCPQNLQKVTLMTHNSEENQSSGSKINQNVLIAIIGAVATILAAIIPWILSRPNAEISTPTPLVITVMAIQALSTETLAPLTETTALTFTPTTEPPAATVTPQVGIFDGFLSIDIKGVIPSTRFQPDQTIYLLFNINDPTGANIIRIVWSVVEAKGFRPGAIKYDMTDKITEDHFVMEAAHADDPWAVGKYKIELYLNDVLDETIEFEIVP